ncbi:MAG: sodium:proton exchanger [Candidatus Vogelbacteria bacterium CG10_big_fil_rev_8_21_14_0_10_45_14]|uniref:Sodium:proton exchanger n=1 Tax=Candidatus Vogelbacteria bacterium CG10_big_fil_rev_8_21_14_0_10_45_14 TaxID=1975042 RepID=A0A2H0RJ29_9BACT|nr:MAG: sodium:proton exchanger [Candidatus Vogelbacteria bacterium CG10_big_fil_rev_8_21_14_0_10_45_14]
MESIMYTLVAFGILLVLAKLGALVERFGQPAVLGELVVGIVLGNLTILGIPYFETLPQNPALAFLAEVGVIILLFQIGLESNIAKLKAVGVSAFFVAVIGVVVPFLLGTYLLGPLLFAHLPFISHLFLGAALTATSVGITARVFQDMKMSESKESQIVISAAVIDDVLGLIILAVVAGLATTGAVSLGGISLIAGKAVLFLMIAVFLGAKLAGHIGSFFSRINEGAGTKLSLALFVCFTFAYFASEVGLAGIVGAYAAGLILDPVHFKRFKKPQHACEIDELCENLDANTKECLKKVANQFTEKHVEDLVKDIGLIVIPLFFVFTGMQVELSAISNPLIWGPALLVLLVAIVGKLLAGLGAGKGVNKLLVGVGMVPRGEVGLIFGTMGLSLGVLTQDLFAVIVIMVIVTTLTAPPLLAYIGKR